MWQYQTFSFLLILGTASSQCAYPAPAASILWEGVLIYGKTWYAQQRFGHPTGFITDKCFLATAGLSDVKPDISIHFPVTYFDERNNQQESTVVSYIVGLKSKFYIHHNNTDFLVSDYVITTSYIVSEICDMNTGRSEVLIFTAQKKRDEDLITTATEEASKIMNLPSPSMSTECESYPFRR